jgi:hypothetical protein
MVTGKQRGWLLERKLDRARFLRLIGAGATLPFVAASFAAFGARSSSAQAVPPTPAYLVAGGEFPIGVWWPPPPGETNQGRYQEIAEANFNFVIGGNGVTNDASIPDALDAAELNDLKFLLTDDPGGRASGSYPRRYRCGHERCGERAAGHHAVHERAGRSRLSPRWYSLRSCSL